MTSSDQLRSDLADLSCQITDVVSGSDASDAVKDSVHVSTKALTRIAIGRIAALEALARDAAATAAAATLRYIGKWDDDARQPGDLAAVATDIDTLRGGAEWICCPVCQEITCDDDCPLAIVRSAAKAASSKTTPAIRPSSPLAAQAAATALP